MDKSLLEEVSNDLSQNTEEKPSSDANTTIDFPITEGFDWSYARLHLRSDDSLLDTLKMFYNSINSYSKELCDFFANIDSESGINSYRIKIHSIKSGATLVGYIQLAGMAMELEKAARESNTDIIYKLHPVFLERYLACKDLLAWLDTEKKSQLDPSLYTDELKELFESIKISASQMDIDVLDKASEKLSEYAFDDSKSVEIGRIKDMILNFETEKLIDFDYSLFFK